jgi:hypothetical protein
VDEQTWSDKIDACATDMSSKSALIILCLCTVVFSQTTLVHLFGVEILFTPFLLDETLQKM